ncbi:MAG: hypothetical protein H6R00_236 [Proteobacteria bacterium]|nr:hypothetical protein [Pseudomonadota bacterium]
MTDKTQAATDAPAAEPEAPTTVSGRAALILDRLDANPFAAGSDTIRDLAGLVAELAAAVEAATAKDA